MLDFDRIVQNYYNITSLLLTLRGPKGPTLGHFPSQGGRPPPAPPLNAPLNEIVIRTNELVFRSYELIFRSYEIILSSM